MNIKIFFYGTLFLLIILRIYYCGNYFLKDDIIFKDPDTCYHARRILYIATHYLQFPFYDPLIAHPYGSIPRWPPLYDWLSALPSFFFTLGNPSYKFTLYSALFLNLIFGTLQLYFLAALMKKATQNDFISILSALFIGTTYPQIKFSSIEVIDHNSLLLSLLSLYLYKLYDVLSYYQQDNKNNKDVIPISLLTAAFFWTWSGSYLYIILFASIEFIYSLITKKFYLFRFFSYTYSIAAILIIPLAIIYYSLGKPIFKMVYSSFFTVLFLLGISASLFLSYFLSKMLFLKLNLIKIILLVLLCLLIIFLLFPSLWEAVKLAAGKNPWLATISESQHSFI